MFNFRLITLRVTSGKSGSYKKLCFVEDFLPRQVMTPNYGVLSAFDEIGFTFPSLLRAQGLDEFMHVQQEIYPHLVKVF